MPHQVLDRADLYRRRMPFAHPLCARLSFALWAALCALSGEAFAHHGPSSQVGTSSLGSLRAGVNGHAVGMSFGYDAIDDSVAAGEVFRAELFGQYRVFDRVSAGLWVPFVWLAPDENSQESGFGNLGLEAKINWPSNSWAHGQSSSAQLRLPTQTVFLGANPGNVWSLALGHTADLAVPHPWLLRAGAWVRGDTSPAGKAGDLAVSLWAGRRTRAVTPYVGLQLATRFGTACKQPKGGFEWCPDGRASEANGRLLEPLLSASLGGQTILAGGHQLSIEGRLPITQAKKTQFSLELSWTLEL